MRLAPPVMLEPIAKPVDMKLVIKEIRRIKDEKRS